MSDDDMLSSRGIIYRLKGKYSGKLDGETIAFSEGALILADGETTLDTELEDLVFKPTAVEEQINRNAGV